MPQWITVDIKIIWSFTKRICSTSKFQCIWTDTMRKNKRIIFHLLHLTLTHVLLTMYPIISHILALDVVMNKHAFMYNYVMYISLHKVYFTNWAENNFIKFWFIFILIINLPFLWLVYYFILSFICKIIIIRNVIIFKFYFASSDFNITFVTVLFCYSSLRLLLYVRFRKANPLVKTMKSKIFRLTDTRNSLLFQSTFWQSKSTHSGKCTKRIKTFEASNSSNFIDTPRYNHMVDLFYQLKQI